MIRCPRLIIAGLGGDTGKTAISVGLCRAWQAQGYKVIPFKKGPDYIDMGWLSHGANHPCYNIDLFLMTKDQILSSFGLNTKKADIAVIEGNRGLYDGMDLEGSVSTAEIAKLLQSPVILIVNCTKVTRTIAALVLGCQMLDSEVPIKGVILNRLAGSRHESIIRKSIEHYCNLPVVGAIPRLKNVTFPGRHLGLVPPQEYPMAEEAIATASEIVKKYLDATKLWQFAQDAPLLNFNCREDTVIKEKKVNIGIIRDSAFQFYYPENIEALERSGARVLEFSALTDDLPPEIDALYIGGGFPETHAEVLSGNEKLRKSIKQAAEDGLPIYAECGGLMYLAEELIWEGKKYPMVNIFPIVIGVSKKPHGHGYTIIEINAPNPYFNTGQILHGHEFHYSYVFNLDEKDSISFCFKMKRGQGIVNKMDGLCYKNVLATYTHIHALGTVEWISSFINTAIRYKKGKEVKYQI
ncbi:MAG: cobyrinic acid a,c-diamide synthase [Nitrospirae bacterium RBG_13_39_12]|nr:MAG: cobyrinic acid a,c-diamide synthase [Nitrospirae bacterium RBG_13_39_12]